MKFKKTKLTALALSVLMAASTITSVTWAADLFTDGTPAEVVVGTPAEIAADLSVEDAANASMLSEARVVTGVSVTGRYQGTNPKYINQELGFQPNEAKDGMVVKFQWIYQGIPETYSDEVITVEAEMDGGIVTAATCYAPAKAKYKATAVFDTKTSFPITSDVAIDVPNSQLTHKFLPNHKLVKKKADSCITPNAKPGIEYSYTGCFNCGALYDPTTGTVKYDSVYGKEMTEDVLKSLPDESLSDIDLLSGYGIIRSEIPVTHDWEEYYKNFVNCSWSSESNSVVGPNDEDNDATYELWHKCKLCGSDEKVKTITYYSAEQTESSIKYVFDYDPKSNIEGFVYYNKSSNRLEIKKTAEKIDMEIPADEYIDVVLKDCSKAGYMYKVSTAGTLETKTPVTVSPHHVWKNTELELKTDNSKTETKETDLLPSNAVNDIYVYDKGYAVKRDDTGNVIEAYSLNCTKEAKYTLFHECFREDSKEVVKVATAPKGNHTFSDWHVNESQTTYTEKSATEHVVHYKDSRECIYCTEVEYRDSQNKADEIKPHDTFEDIMVEGSEIAATCGTEGSYDSGKGCPKCNYIDKSTITTVTVPATDKHDFGTNEPFIEWRGEVQIGDDDHKYKITNYSVYGNIVRKCNICGKTDSNGVYNSVAKVEIKPGNKELSNNNNGPQTQFMSIYSKALGKSYGTVIPGKKNPATGVAYSCSVDQIPVTIKWTGTVDGKPYTLNATKTVPYYKDEIAYTGTTAHQPGAVKVENKVAATVEKEGSYENVVYCNVCGYEISREKVTVPKLDPEVQVSVPTVTATAANYNTVNVSWTPVEGATAYRLYYRSADLGITTWHRVRTLKGTSFTHSGLTTGARYRYTVRAEVNGKLGDYSRTGSVARPLPAAPEMKSVTAVSNGTKITWSKVDGADGYIIFRKTPTGTFTRVGSVSKGTKVTWTDKKAVSGSTYKVRAYRTVDNVNYKGAFSAAM